MSRARAPRGMRKRNCSKCNGSKEPSRMNQRYCKTCHRNYMQELRKIKNGFGI